MYKTILLSAILSLAVLTFIGCNKENSGSGNGAVGGDVTDIGKTGNEFWTSLMGVSNEYGVVTKSENGISTVAFSGTLTEPKYKEMAALIPSFEFGSYDPVSGSFSINAKMKFTNEGVVDYLNASEKPFTIGRYDAEVGDTYTYESAHGGTFTRTVTRKSEDDDYPYAFFDIKTITIEEAGRNPAVKKIEYYINHKFGLVGAKVTLQDGSAYESNLFSVGEN